MNYFQRRAKELGLDVPESGQRQQGENYFQQRSRELGVNVNSSPQAVQAPSSSSSDFFTQRQMELGIIPDTRVTSSTQQKSSIIRTPDVAFNRPGQVLDIGQAAKNYVSDSKKREAENIARLEQQLKNNPVPDIGQTVMGISKQLAAMPKTEPQTPQEWVDAQHERRMKETEGPGIMNWIGRNIAEPLIQGIDYVQAYTPGLAAFQQGAGEALNVQTSTAPVQDDVASKVGGVLGNIAGYATNPAQLESSLFTGGYKVADHLIGSKAGQKLLGASQRGASNLSPALNTAGINLGRVTSDKLVNNAFRGGIAGAVHNTANSAIRGETDIDQLGKAALIGGAWGAPGDMALGALGGAFKGVANRLDNTARTLTETNPVFRTMVSEMGENHAKAQLGRQWLNDLDDQITSLRSMDTAPLNPNARANMVEQMNGLQGQRNATISYIKQYDPSFATSPQGAVIPSQVQRGSLGGRQPLVTSNVKPAAEGEVLPLQTQIGPKMDNAQPPSQRPPVTELQTGEQPRGFIQSLRESDKPPQGFKEKLSGAYRQISNEETVLAANKRINKDVEEAASYVLGNSRFTAEKAAVGQRLIDHYNSAGNYQRAVDIAEKVAEEATRAGQSIQALSLFDRLTPEGVLIRAQRIAKRTNESLKLHQKEVTVTPQMASDIDTLARASKNMTGVKDLSNDVMDILDRAKSGAKLTDTETQTLKRFVDESKQFVKETTKAPKPPKPPKQPKDQRVRDNVVKFLDAQEEAAKARLRERGIRISSTPLDIWADYAIIGAAKMGKGTIKFADWSEQMVKDLGESIRPQLNQLYERSREAYEASSKKVSQQTISTAERMAEKVIKNKQISPEDSAPLRELARKVSRLSGEAKNIASQDLQVILQALENPTWLKKVSSAQTIAQLLNPKTQVRNIVGNELFYRWEQINKLLATPIDFARSKITGGPRTVTFKTNNQGRYWYNWMRGGKAGWKGTNVNGIETQYDLGGPAYGNSFKYNPMKYLEKALGASLKSFDTAAYMRAYNDTLGEQATLRALNEGQGGDKALIQRYIREADDNMVKLADEYGKYVTFQDNNAISKGLVGLKKGLNLKKDFGLGDLILKYPKTPGALLHRALEYSPAGFLRSAYMLAKPLLKKEVNTREATLALSRAIMGTFGLTGMGMYLMDKGVLTGAVSKDKDVRELQKAAGQGQYQVNLSALIRLAKSGFDDKGVKLQEGDFLYTYDWAQPLSMSTSVGANIVKNMGEGKQKFDGLAGTIYNSLEGGLGTLTEQSVVQGLKRAADGYPGQTVTDKILDVLSDIPSSFVPTAFNQYRQLQDNSKPETYSPNKWEQTWNKAQAKIPGLSGDLPRQYDTLGREKQTYDDNNFFNVLLNPGFSSRYDLSPEAKLLVELIEETGDESLAPRAAGKTIRVKGESIKLNGDMYSRYQQLLGEETRSRISKINPNNSLKSKIKAVDKAYDKAGERARKELIR